MEHIATEASCVKIKTQAIAFQVRNCFEGQRTMRYEVILALAFGIVGATTAGAQVTSFNTRTGAITLQSTDVTTALGFTPLNKAGGTLNAGATLNFQGTGSTPSSLGLTASNPTSYTSNTGQILATFSPNAPQAPSTSIPVVFNGQFYTKILTPSPAAANNAFIWSVLSSVNYQSTGGGTGQNAGIYGQGIRAAAATQATTIATSSTSTIVQVEDTTPFQSYNGGPFQAQTQCQSLLIIIAISVLAQAPRLG